MRFDLLSRVEDLRCGVRVGRVVGPVSSTEGATANGVEGANAATEGGWKDQCPLVLAFASGEGVYAFPIADTPYHTYRPGDGWGVWICRDVARRCQCGGHVRRGRRRRRGGRRTHASFSASAIRSCPFPAAAGGTRSRGPRTERRCWIGLVAELAVAGAAPSLLRRLRVLKLRECRSTSVDG